MARRTTPVLDDPGGGAGDGSAKEARLWYVVTDHLGTPRELLSEDGSLVWAAEYTTWGSVRRLWQADNDTGPLGNFQGHDFDGNPVYSTRVYGTDGNAAIKPAENPNEYACPIRFQGQWADEETGLYYNRFRYYDPSAAQYMSYDPIGLSGGLRTHGYVEAPTGWIDPFGLAGKRCCCPKWGEFTGGENNSEFIPKDAVSHGLKPGDTIPFEGGTPNFRKYAQHVIEVPGLTGDPAGDARKARKVIAKKYGVSPEKIRRMLSARDL